MKATLFVGLLFALVTVPVTVPNTVSKISTQSAYALSEYSQKDNKTLCNFFPANKLRFPIKNDGSQMKRAQFKKILEAAEGVYKPVFKSFGLGNFNIVDRWHDDTVNACASIGVPCSQIKTAAQQRASTGDRYVEMYGGLARHPYLTAEGLMLVICHEIGHHLAGFPRYGNNSEVLSTEGQSDYFATAKCARLIYSALTPKTNENWAWTNKNKIPQEVQQPCLSVFGNSAQAIYCMRSSLAGLSLAQTLGSLSNIDPRQLSFILKDKNVVQTTFESHPKAQCRLDTYVAGALCGADPRIPFSMINPTQGACVNKQVVGTRPACWFSNQMLSLR